MPKPPGGDPQLLAEEKKASLPAEQLAEKLRQRMIRILKGKICPLGQKEKPGGSTRL